MRECREPEVERPCWNAPARLLPELDRFIALAGMGIAETLLFMPPSVCGLVSVCARVYTSFGLITSRGRRTENICVSCDMLELLQRVCEMVCALEVSGRFVPSLCVNYLLWW